MVSNSICFRSNKYLAKWNCYVLVAECNLMNQILQEQHTFRRENEWNLFHDYFLHVLAAVTLNMLIKMCGNGIQLAIMAIIRIKTVDL